MANHLPAAEPQQPPLVYAVTVESKKLIEGFNKEKRLVDRFLGSKVPSSILSYIKELGKNLSLAEEKQLTAQEKVEQRNLQALKKELPQLQHPTYLQMLPLLYKFPSKQQIGLNKELLKKIDEATPLADLVQLVFPYLSLDKNISLQRFLVNCISLSHLRERQLNALKRLAAGESILARALQIQGEMGIVANRFLLLQKLGGSGRVCINQALDLGTNQPVVVKYIRKEDEAGEVSRMDLEEERRRFEREARAFEKLEKHRQQKMAGAEAMLESGKQLIEDGSREKLQSKVQKGKELVLQADQILCDRYFVRNFMLATGKFSPFIPVAQGIMRAEEETIGFMVMEYIPGASLDRCLREYQRRGQPMGMVAVIKILEGVLRALDYCHQEGIIHRDIRPDNILVDPQFRVRLTNLGRAKVEDMTQLTAQGAFVGTPIYAAPEGIVGKTDLGEGESEKLIGQTDARFDLYSLGCVVYEMLVGSPPFVSEESDPELRKMAILHKHLHQAPIPPREIRPDVPQALNDIVMKLLAKNPHERFQSAREILVSLAAYLKSTRTPINLAKSVLSKISLPFRKK